VSFAAQQRVDVQTRHGPRRFALALLAFRLRWD
jgi:hypothetical protein